MTGLGAPARGGSALVEARVRRRGRAPARRRPRAGRPVPRPLPLRRGVDRLLAGPRAAVRPRRPAARRSAEAADAGRPPARAGRTRRPDRLDVEICCSRRSPPTSTARFEQLYGYLNDDVTRRRATVGLALRAVRRPRAPRRRRGPGWPRARRCSTGLLDRRGARTGRSCPGAAGARPGGRAPARRRPTRPRARRRPRRHPDLPPTTPRQPAAPVRRARPGARRGGRPAGLPARTPGRRTGRSRSPPRRSRPDRRRGLDLRRLPRPARRPTSSSASRCREALLRGAGLVAGPVEAGRRGPGRRCAGTRRSRAGAAIGDARWDPAGARRRRCSLDVAASRRRRTGRAVASDSTGCGAERRSRRG